MQGDADFPPSLSGRLLPSMIMSSNDPLGASSSASETSSISHSSPLHTPLSSASTPLPHHHSQSTVAAPSPPRYVPYTPRQRTTTTTTTSTTISTSLSLSTSLGHPTNNHAAAGSSTAQGKLQVQQLKAVVQSMGLDNASVGWCILEKLVGGDVEGAEWDAIWNAVAIGQCTLLLPTEKASAGLIVTPEFVRDHIAFVPGPVRDSTPLVTMGGLRGTISEDSLQIRSALPTNAEPFASIANPASRSRAFSSMAPLPSSYQDPSVPYPTFSISDHLTSLHIPPRPVPTLPPPLPPRPSSSATSAVTTPTAGAGAGGGGLSGRFASLFAGRGSTAASPTITHAPLPSLPSIPSSSSTTSSSPYPPRPTSPNPPSSIRSEASIDSSHSHSPYSLEGHYVSAFAIDKRILRKDVSKAVGKALKADIKQRLGGLPSWVSERVLSFTVPVQPLSSKYGGAPSSPVLITKGPSPNVGAAAAAAADNRDFVIDLSVGVNEMAESVQVLYDTVEEDLRKAWGPKWKSASTDEEKGVPGSASLEKSVEELVSTVAADGEREPKEKEVKEKEKDKAEMLEERIGEAMERVERCVTEVFYNHLFLPASSDDSSHDEALSNRIGALNMLDLGLEHLGVEMEDGSSPNGINKIAKAIGFELEKLGGEECRCPKDKAAVLVGVSKMIVEGLTRLPAVRLKPEGEVEAPPQSSPIEGKTPRQADFSGAQNQNQKLQTMPEPYSSIPKVIKSPPASLLDSPRAGYKASIRSLSPTPGDRHTSKPPSIVFPDETHIQSPTQAMSPALPTPSDAPSIVEEPHVLEVDPTSPDAPVITKHSEINTDVLLPIIIYAVVKSNPVRLVSQLLFVQRFRRGGGYGEESFCLINFLAVVEFLEHVDMAALGLTSASNIIATSDLTPLPLPLGSAASSSSSSTTHSPITAVSARLRGRVEQQVGELATGATKVISGVGGVVDSSFSVLRGLLNNPLDPNSLDPTSSSSGGGGGSGAGTGLIRPNFGLLRRGTSFSIAGVAASIPGVGAPIAAATSSSKSERGVHVDGESGQQLMEVPSRPQSVRRLSHDEFSSDGEGGSSSASDAEDDDARAQSDDYDDDEDTADADTRSQGGGSIFKDKSDTRSIRSFSSMMSGTRDRDRDRDEWDGTGSLREKKKGGNTNDRPSLSDRLKGLGADTSSTPSRRTSLLPPLPATSTNPTSSPSVVMVGIPPENRIAPPNTRFLQSSADELRISEIPVLLAEYRRMVDALRSAGGFQD